MDIKIKKDNERVLEMLSFYLNFNANGIKADMVKSMVDDFSVSEDEAVRMLAASLMGLDIVENLADKELFNKYFKTMLKRLDLNKYKSNPYYRNIRFENLKQGGIEFKEGRYEPYELFVYNDLEELKDGRIIPQIGYFNEEFRFPSVLENCVEWMTITPNEIETMREDIATARGKVLMFGLGLGYFAYMASLKKEVEEITIVELNQNVIDLFKKHILPQFEFKDKIKIINSEATTFAKNNYKRNTFNFVYVDIWHDVGDGIEIYNQMKNLECLNPKMEYRYWIEKSIKCYLKP